MTAVACACPRCVKSPDRAVPEQPVEFGWAVGDPSVRGEAKARLAAGVYPPDDGATVELEP